MKLVSSNAFGKKYHKISISNKKAKISIDKTLRLMEEDIFHPLLQTHKLSGRLSEYWASICGYDCRIIFKFVKSNLSNDNVILLLNIGTHDEVY
jgi:mRNA-degrading endonuclease YafQ of YafQ-DinJ toxin-antitoxin module